MEKNNEVVREALSGYIESTGTNASRLALSLGVAPCQMARWTKTGRIGYAWTTILKSKGILPKDTE
jgi:hypothetical protein